MSERRWPEGLSGSPSRLKRFESCPLSYRFRYVDGIKDPTGSTGRVGLLVHGALEVVSRARVGLKAPPAAQAAELLEALGASVGEARGTTPKELSDARDLLELIAPFDPTAGGEILSVEQDWAVDVGEGIKFGGWWDLARRADSGVVQVVDWKSGQLQSRADLEVDPQAQLTLAAAYEAFPEDDVEVVFVYVADGLVASIAIPWEEGLDRMGRGRALAAYKSWTRGNARARVGDSCRYCFARDRCGPYQDHLKALEVPTDPPSPKDLPLVELLEERRRFSEIEKAADARRKDLDSEIKFRIDEEAQGGALDVPGLRARIAERRTGRYDVAVLPELAAELGLDPYDVIRKAGRVSSSDLKKLVKGNEDAKRLVEKYRSGGRSRYVEVRTIKEKLA